MINEINALIGMKAEPKAKGNNPEARSKKDGDEKSFVRHQRHGKQCRWNNKMHEMAWTKNDGRVQRTHSQTHRHTHRSQTAHAVCRLNPRNDLCDFCIRVCLSLRFWCLLSLRLVVFESFNLLNLFISLPRSIFAHQNEPSEPRCIRSFRFWYLLNTNKWAKR